MGKSKNKKQSSYNSNGNNSNNGNFNKKTSWNSKNSQNDSRIRSNSASESLWNDSEEHFPALGAVAAPLPRVNVWEERKLKQEAVKSLEPQNEYDEQFMLQQALALSMMEAENEERRRREEEEGYLVQVQALENVSEELEYFGTSEEPVLNSAYKLGTSSETEPTESFVRTNISRNSNIPDCNQNMKTYSCNGAKPKINKVIERFGGWGLKDEKVTSNSDRLSDFIDDVVNEKSPKKANKNNKITINKDKSDWKALKENEAEGLWHVSDTKEVKKPSTFSNPWEENETKDLWHATDMKEVKKPSACLNPLVENEVLYDEKGTFIVDEDESNDIQKNHADEVPKYTSSNKVLDTWLNSEDNVKENDKKETSNAIDIQSDKVSSNTNFVDNHWQECEQLEDKLSSISYSIGYKSEEVSNKVNGTFDFDECDKSSWSHHQIGNEPTKSNFTTYNFDGNEHCVAKFPHSIEPVQNTHLPSNDVLSENPVNASSYFNLFPGEAVQPKTNNLEVKPVEFGRSLESEIFNSISNKEDDVAPILPPQPAPTSEIKEQNKAFINEVLNANSEPESLPIKPPQPVPHQPSPEIQTPFLGMNPLLLSPAALFPGFNPLLPCGMDPITMRQMLMLSNPFFASQLLAMEQYYRSVGMPVDMFSLSGAMPVAPVPGLIGVPTDQHAFGNTFPSTNSSVPQQLQSNFSSESFPVSQGNNISSDQKSFDNCTQPLDFGDVASPKNTLSEEQNRDNDFLYKTFLSSDSSAAIPPPKPPSFIDTNDNVVPIHAPSSQSACSFNQNSLPTRTHSSSMPTTEQDRKPISAIEACTTKIESTGWSDDESESSKTQTKTVTGWDDDDFGWGSDSVPAKSFNNHSASEDKRKTVCRQPSRQPQFSRYQRNKT